MKILIKLLIDPIKINYINQIYLINKTNANKTNKIMWAFAKQRCRPGLDVQENRGQNIVQIHGLQFPKPNAEQFIFIQGV